MHMCACMPAMIYDSNKFETAFTTRRKKIGFIPINCYHNFDYILEMDRSLLINVFFVVSYFIFVKYFNYASFKVKHFFIHLFWL